LSRSARGFSALKLVHAVVFGGLFAVVLRFTRGEALQFVRGITEPYSFGAVPSPLALAAVVVACASALGMLALIARRRPVPLWLSAAMLGAFALAFIDSTLAPDRQRSPSQPNRQVTVVANELHRRLTERLRQEAEVPGDLESLEPLLEDVLAATAPWTELRAHSRCFRRLPYRLVRVNERDEVPKGVAPGWLLLWVSDDRVAYQIVPVGFSESGEVRVLTDNALRGVFDPEWLGLPGP
jgi:hypothetical protein